MPTLYSLYEGSLADLEPEIDRLLAGGLPEAEDEEEIPERERALISAIDGRWTWSRGRLDQTIFHKDEDLLLAQVSAVSAEAGVLVGALLGGDVVGISRWEFGFVGSLTAAEIVRLVALLEPVVATRAQALLQDRAAQDRRVDPADPLDGPTRILAGLLGVTPGADIALRLG